ncbi:MAG: methylenetetrahydrofolate reductase [Desulfovibrionaceae bacterium]|nr:methylenetetrahydrofolate reductase [NAD(P)H] [Desulfovibrionaceae bacterium]
MKISDKLKNCQKPFCSLEFFPPREREQWPAFYQIVERLAEVNPKFVSITYGAGGSTQDNTLDVARHLHSELGLETLVHLTCVKSNKEKIDAFLNSLKEAGIENILALRGDPPRGEAYDWSSSEFTYASDLVRYVRSRHPGFDVGVAAYPYPHPESKSFQADRKFTQQKIQAGANFVITQLMFDVREYFDLVERLNSLGIMTPIIPGVLPVLSMESLRRTLSMCGANMPGKLFFQLEEAHNQGGAEAVREAGTHFAIEQCRQLLEWGAPGIHLYTLNRAETCLRIVNELRSMGLLPA